jgi:nitrous oxidase accessory protein NosD
MDAILAASSGDTIFVAAGNYQESLIIDKDINIIGTAGAAQTTSTPGSLHAQQL